MARKTISIPGYLLRKVSDLDGIRPDFKGLDENQKIRILLQERITELFLNPRIKISEENIYNLRFESQKLTPFVSGV